jgi:hypothetical protein
MRQASDHPKAPVRQELLKYINMIRAETTAKMVPEPVALSRRLMSEGGKEAVHADEDVNGKRDPPVSSDD